MTTLIIMLLTYFTMTGVSAALYVFIGLTAGEGMVIAAVLLSGWMHAGAALGMVKAAALSYAALGIIGITIFFIRGKQKKQFFSLSLVLITVLFAGALFAYRNAFIQNIDDFHQWAAAVRYMLEKGHLPQADFLGSASMPAYTGTFHLYFQVIGGYNEGVMYASSVLLNGIPLLLPVAYMSWKSWKRGLWYAAAVYLGMFHLYNHPYKSLYVDLTAAAWAACLVIWWLHYLQDKQRSGHRPYTAAALVVFFIPTAWFTIVSKWGMGLLLLGFALLFMLISTLIYKGKKELSIVYRSYSRQIWMGIGAAIVIMLAAAFIFKKNLIPISLGGVKEALTFSTEKAQKTWTTLIDRIFTKKLNSMSRLQITAVPAVLVIGLTTVIGASWESGKRRSIFLMQSIFTWVSFCLYTIALYVTYVSTFSYDESVSNAAVHRYLSCMVLFLFFILMGNLAQTKGRKHDLTKIFAASLSLASFIIGLTSSFISEASGYHYWEVYGYKQIKEAKAQLKELNTLVKEDEKVYVLHQQPTLAATDELTLCTLLYYREGGVSNYLIEPWKFTEEGSLRMVRRSDQTLEDLPQMLIDGGYSYLWVYTTDDYLAEELPEQFDIQGDITDRALYRVSETDDYIVLERVEYE